MEKQSTTGLLDEFQTELVDCWRRLPNKGFFFALLAGWLALFQFLGNATFGYVDTPSLFGWMLNAYTAHGADGSMTDDSLGMLIPVVVLGLLWWKRKELMELPFRIWQPALALILFGLVLHILGYVVQQPRLSIVALFVGIYGLTGLAWGPEWLRKTFFPFVLFAFCIPFASLLEPIAFRLRMLSCGIVEWLCHYVLALEVIREGTILKDPAGQYHYEVAAACGGIRSLVSIGLIGTIWGILCFRGWWRRGLMIALAAPLAVAGNVVRLLSIVIAAEFFGGQDAGNYVHEGGPLGIVSLLPYALAIIGLILAEKFFREPAESQLKPA